MLKTLMLAVLFAVVGNPNADEMRNVIDNAASSPQQGFKVHISVDMEGLAGSSGLEPHVVGGTQLCCCAGSDDRGS